MAKLSLKRTRAPKEPVKQVRLKLRSIDVWSAVKVGFLISIALAIGTIVSTWLIWSVLSNSGVILSLSNLIGSVLGEESDFNLSAELAYERVMSTAITLSLINIVLTTALAAIWAALFNVISKIVGGVAVTFTNN